MSPRSYAVILRQLGLENTTQVRRAKGKRIKTQRCRRDVQVFDGADDEGRLVRLYVKRTFRAVPKDAGRTILQHGRVWSCSREEYENLLSLRAVGISTCEPVAYGEECSVVSEQFSYLITAAVPAEQTLLDFLHTCRDKRARRRVLAELARVVRRMHDRGLTWPDLYARHVYVQPELEPPGIILIDVARLERPWWVSSLRRARDLANLSLSTPGLLASRSERLRFLREYAAGSISRLMLLAIRLRVARLSRSSKGRKLMASRPLVLAGAEG